jgi:hypothetical protein
VGRPQARPGHPQPARGRRRPAPRPRHHRHSHYRFRAPAGGGNPVVWNATRYRLISIDRVELVGAEFVGHLPGRKSRLPASTATVAVFEDLVLGGEVVLIVIHLTAEVQVGAGYRTDLAHRLRVRRHKRERARSSASSATSSAPGAVVRVVGDTNFDGMTLPPLTSCWVGHKRDEAAGTLGRRTVDYVFARGHSADVQTLPTRSDHDAVVAIYRRKEKPCPRPGDRPPARSSRPPSPWLPCGG